MIKISTSKVRSSVSVAALFLALQLSASFAEIPYATDAPRSLTPEESIASFQLPPDLRIELVASEPNIIEPGAMVFDEFGRLFVGELHGYNLEGYYDIVELNKTGVLDREVRRVRVGGAFLKRARDEAVGVIKMLEDKDGDGLFESARLWATDLPPCYGLVRARQGLIAVCPPKILYLADLDGDGRAEHRETLFEGFGFDVLERGINSARRGPDNWIYISAGGGGGDITGPHLAQPLRMGHTDFRIRDDGSAIEPITGAGGTFGLALTEFTDHFIASTNRHALYATPLERRHLIRNPYVASPGGNVDAAGYDQIYPTSPPDPWRFARNADPNWVDFYGQRETTPNGYFTSACGPLIYQGGTLPEAYWGNHFACEPANNLVTRGLLSRDGAGYRVTRVPGEIASEFLTSTDRWFRPINLEMGPDGALYIIDFYREIIEDYSAIPRHLQQRYVESLREGYEHGRIWRVSARDTAGLRHTRLGNVSLKNLVDALESENPWERETAQRLIISGASKSAAQLVRTLYTESKSPIARVHALYTLDGLGSLEPADVKGALADENYGLRLHALRLAERWMDTSVSVRSQALSLADDPDPSVRLQAAQSLGEGSHPEIADALASMAINFGDERWMPAAIVSSATNRADALLATLFNTPESTKTVAKIVSSLAATVAAQGNIETTDRILRIAAASQNGASPALQIALLEGLAEGLKNNKSNQPSEDFQFDGLVQLLTHSEPKVRDHALTVAGLLHLGDSPIMQSAWEAAQLAALDNSLSVEMRVDAINLLTAAPWAYKIRLAELLDARVPVNLQLAAVRIIGTATDEAAPNVLTKPYESMSPQVQEAILDELFAREDRLVFVLDAIEGGTILPGAIPPIRRLQMLESGSQQIKDRAAKLLKIKDASQRAEIIKKYQPALNLPRDIKRGLAIFEERCSSCHMLRGVGQEVGPNLSAIRSRPDETLLSDMLDPSGVITPGYTAYIVATQDGGLFSGMLAEETATSITLRSKGETDTILRSRIVEMQTSDVSLMPDGLAEGLTVQDIADLLGYLRDAGGEFNRAGVLVFDDEPEFIAALKEGDGDITLSVINPYSGTSSLRVTPLQRHSRQIEGWRYRIVENPKLATDGPLEEIRYLRMAWKTEGEGVMIELADNGNWPPSESPLRRYFSGENLTNWQATRISAAPPRDWSVITVDLWNDFGEFTLTGIAPTAIGGPAYFDHIELLASIDGVQADND